MSSELEKPNKASRKDGVVTPEERRELHQSLQFCRILAGVGILGWIVALPMVIAVVTMPGDNTPLMIAGASFGIFGSIMFFLSVTFKEGLPTLYADAWAEWEAYTSQIKAAGKQQRAK